MSQTLNQIAHFLKRVFFKDPKHGDLVVFKTPQDNRTDYIKRLIGIPGDTIEFINGEIFINEKIIVREKIDFKDKFITENTRVSYPIHYIKNLLVLDQ